MAKENTTTWVAPTTKENGKTGNKMASVKKHGQMAPAMQATTKKTKSMEAEFISQKKVMSTMAISTWASWTETASINGLTADDMKGLGKITKCTGEAFSRGPMANKYEGEYQKDVVEGFGEFIWPDGSKYIGTWKNGRQHGKGTLIDEKGQAFDAEWINGKMVDQGTESEASSMKQDQVEVEVN